MEDWTAKNLAMTLRGDVGTDVDGNKVIDIFSRYLLLVCLIFLHSLDDAADLISNCGEDGSGLGSPARCWLSSRRQRRAKADASLNKRRLGENRR
jgi:hypothetical protein